MYVQGQNLGTQNNLCLVSYRCFFLTLELSLVFSLEDGIALCIKVDIILTVAPTWFTLINKHNKQFTENTFSVLHNL